MPPKFTVIESPFAGKTPVEADQNIKYLHACIRDCLSRGEIPYASHGFFPGALDDNIPEQRKQGIEAGFAIGRKLSEGGAVRAFYVDRGMSKGMHLGLEDAISNNNWKIEFRWLGHEWRIEHDPKE